MKLSEITQDELSVERDTGNEIHLKNKKTGVKTIVPKDKNKPGTISQDENGEFIVNPNAGDVDNKLTVGSKVKMATNNQKKPGTSPPQSPQKPQSNQQNTHRKHSGFGG